VVPVCNTFQDTLCIILRVMLYIFKSRIGIIMFEVVIFFFFNLFLGRAKMKEEKQSYCTPVNAFIFRSIYFACGLIQFPFQSSKIIH